MTSLWPWLAVAGLGALHGANPATGWMFAAVCGVRAEDPAQARRALLPIGVGHGMSVALVALALAQGLAFDRAGFQMLAGALLVGAAGWRALKRGTPRMHRSTASLPKRRSGTAGHVGLALWSFLMATAHGAGMMLVPALVPLCLSSGPAREITASGSLALALAAVGLHTAAMLATTGLIAAGVCRGVAGHARLVGGAIPQRALTAALGVTGALLIACR
ncbi:MAG: hypothetical protein ABIS28_18150 [Caldimonas sp.]